MLQLTERTTEAPFTGQFVRNRFLQTLTAHEFDQLRPHLTSVTLKARAIIHEENKPVSALYFIESGVVSRIVRTQSDGPVEVAMVGNSGFIGLSVILGTFIALHRTIVLIPGTALRISAERLLAAMGTDQLVRNKLLRYAQDLSAQNAQISLCNVRHSVEQRLSRWLLQAHDRVGDDTLPVTHDLLAMLLGVRRSGVSEVLHEFERDGILKKGRATLSIRNRELLQQRSCECYRHIEERSFWQRKPTLHQHAFRAE